jgi:hypothetical protein
MSGALELAGAAREPSSFAPLHTDRIFTGFWPNRSVLRDGATTEYQLRYGLGRQDSMWKGSYNTEVSPNLTLIRRPGLDVFNAASIAPIKSFYSFHTFTLTTEAVHVLADTANTIYDVTTGQSVVFSKSPGAGRAYFLGVGNTLYITDGVDNVQWHYDTGQTFQWGIPAPTTAPTAQQSLRPSDFLSWTPLTAYSVQTPGGPRIALVDTNNNIQIFVGQPNLLSDPAPVAQAPTPNGVTGTIQPTWHTDGTSTPDGTVTWQWGGSADWIANHSYGPFTIVAAVVTTTTGVVKMFFMNITLGGQYVSGATPPHWPSAIGTKVPDGANIVWQNIGNALTWVDSLGPSCPIISSVSILDPKGYIQYVIGAGKTSVGPQPPNFQTTTGAVTYDGTAIWQNQGPFAIAAALPVQYGYAYQNDVTKDLSGMSPPSPPILVLLGNQVTVQGPGSGLAGVSSIPIYRTGQGEATFNLRATVPNPGAGQTWTFVDTDLTDNSLNFAIQAQVLGEGTPLPAGAGPMAYHLGRIFVGVGNVVWVSSGPDAAASASSGNAGFDQFFTLESKITRFWVTSLGLIVFTVRDSYIFLGSAQDSDPLYVKVYIPRLPLLSYDCFTEYMGSAYLYLGMRLVCKLDPGAGVVEVSFPVANYLLDDVANYDPKSSYLTFHTEGSNETALYLSNGISEWLRMSLSTVPEQGSAWNPPAILSDGTSAVQSVEVDSGIFRLLVGPQATGPIRKRNRAKATDNGRLYSCYSRFGSIAMADPAMLAGLAWMTLTSTIYGTAPKFSALIGEIDGDFEEIKRTHQDPPDLPVADSVRSDRHHFLQGQEPVWCRHFQFAIDWPAEDAFNELLTFTIVGQIVQEMKGS